MKHAAFYAQLVDEETGEKVRTRTWKGGEGGVKIVPCMRTQSMETLNLAEPFCLISQGVKARLKVPETIIFKRVVSSAVMQG